MEAPAAAGGDRATGDRRRDGAMRRKNLDKNRRAEYHSRTGARQVQFFDPSGEQIRAMETIIKGIPVSQGVAIGPAYVLGSVESKLPPSYLSGEEMIPDEVERFQQAVGAAQAEIGKLKSRVQAEAMQDVGSIFEAHILILSDPSLHAEVLRRIQRNRMTAEYAVQCTFGEYVRGLKGKPFLNPRINDIQDIERRLLKAILGRHYEELHSLAREVVVIAHDLTPSQTAGMDRERILGFAADIGGTTGHTAIVARAREIPAVVGLGSVSDTIQSGAEVILDGSRGLLIIQPTESTRRTYEKIRSDFRKFGAELLSEASQPAVTLDGCRVHVQGNIEFPHEAESVLKNGADGVGLYRTEFIYIDNQGVPDEETHFAAYARVVKALGGRPVTIRTLDLGSDKAFQLQDHERMNLEKNPGLGLRAVRYCFANPDLFRAQIRAICRASAFGEVQMLIPMVSAREEVQKVMRMVRGIQERLADEGVPFDPNMKVGIMVEVPSVAITIDQFCDICEYFSIGTNDLTQYLLAVDRANEQVAQIFRPDHPSVLRVLKFVIETAKANQVPVALCGEMAGDPLFVPYLLGLGLRTFSVSPPQIPEVKKIIRNASLTAAEKVADDVASLSSARDVRNCLRAAARDILGLNV
ncbi:MAG: phosphoenolpyruvate--protein phosphotransferase [Planctomycetota bacterium]|jgi:phosphotransferase system enzyme I (PtsI)|nr:phosphoenolpyruvate--protein phosphotransferase [Planctomycetota bacterium]